MKNRKTKSERRCLAKVYAYVNPERQYRVPTDRHWYWERKILYSGKDFVIGYEEGYKVKWSLQVYEFHSVYLEKVPKLIAYLKAHPDKYPGYLHHINLYGGITKKFKQQIKID